MEVKVGAELQTPVGMRQGNGSLDVVGNGLTGSVGKVVKGKDNNMIADTDTAVVTAITHKCLLHFYIVNMQMFATLDGLNNSTDIGAVFNNGVANIEILKGNLMADRNIIKSCDLNI